MTQRRNAEREQISKKVEEIDKSVHGIISKMSELLSRIGKNDVDDFDRYLNRSLNSIIERVNEMDEVSKSMQRNYIQRLSKILETRKQAEVNFLDERKKFTDMIRDIEMAYQRKNEAFQSRLKKELTLLKNAYDKIKDENGSLS